jgi:hypothetical protein
MAAPLTGRNFTDKELEVKAAHYAKVSAETIDKLFTPRDAEVLKSYLKEVN